jgi:membrane protease subunit (stomatin/prohibitin family)
MGIIKAIAGAVGGGLADQWVEVMEPDNMDGDTVFTGGIGTRRGNGRSSNTKGTGGVVTDGSVIHVYDNQFMFITDGGKVVDYTAEPGYYTYKNDRAPSLFNGDLGKSVKETFSRIKYGGMPSQSQKVFYVNLQEIKGIKFGTRNAINYFDPFYNAELFLRAHGAYSIKINDPLKFYQEAIPRNAGRVTIGDINEQYLTEFLDGLQSAINRFSADGERISFITSKSREIGKYMAEALDADWNRLRGMEVLSVGIASISYDEASQRLINLRNEGAMMSDPNIREGYVQASMARGVEAAGGNEGGAGQAFMGVGMGMQAGGGMASAFSRSNAQQIDNQTAAANGRVWACPKCGHENTPENKFCGECGEPRPQNSRWTCGECGHENTGNAKFCANCGSKKE